METYKKFKLETFKDSLEMFIKNRLCCFIYHINLFIFVNEYKLYILNGLIITTI